MKRTKGFTLIEMLIVIAVIGVLAVAVLSAINPVEQLRKARDTRRRSNAAELLNAIERYYATTEENPTMSSAAGATACGTVVAASAIGANDLTDLINSNELKAEFSTRVVGSTDNALRVGMNTSSDLVSVCYQIESAANIAEYGTASNHCTLATGEHFLCLPE